MGPIFREVFPNPKPQSETSNPWLTCPNIFTGEALLRTAIVTLQSVGISEISGGETPKSLEFESSRDLKKRSVAATGLRILKQCQR